VTGILRSVILQKVVIIGGGISGLSLAWFLQQSNKFERTLLEAESRIGGKINSIKTDNGFMVEAGPNTVLQKFGRDDDALGRLIDSLNIQDDLIIANEIVNNRFIVKNRKLCKVPRTPFGLLTSPLFSFMGKLRIGLEPFIKPAKSEETIKEFVTRRLGQEFYDYSIEPFISGVHAGDPNKLSVRSAVPKIYELEQKYGSLIKAALKMRQIGKDTGAPKGRMISFTHGLNTICDAIKKQLPNKCVITDSNVKTICKNNEQWEVKTAEQTYIADKVIFATPAKETAEIISEHSPQASKLINRIEYAPIIVCALSYPKNSIKHPMNGYGFLVPRKENIRTLGCLFSHNIFAGKAPDGSNLLTCFLGGATDKKAIEIPQDEIIKTINEELKELLGHNQDNPEVIYFKKYERAIPQYQMGHQNILDDLSKEIPDSSNIVFCSNWNKGLSVADCIKNAENIAQKLSLY